MFEMPLTSPYRSAGSKKLRPLSRMQPAWAGKVRAAGARRGSRRGVRSHQTCDFTRLDGEGNVVQGRPVVSRIREDDAVELDAQAKAGTAGPREPLS